MDRTSSMGLWTWASNYYVAACELVKLRNANVDAPAYYLVSHAIELALKAFLRGSGYSLDDLKSPRKFGHDLSKCLHHACERGLRSYMDINEDDIGVISIINNYYKDKELEYIVTGYKTYPKIEILLAFTDRLLGTTRQFCYDKMDVHSSVSS